MAQDTAAPAINIASPADGASFTVGQVVNASYACTDDPGPVTECAGPVASDAPLDTSEAGTFQFTVTARDAAGNTSTRTHNYSVVQQDTDPGDVGGDTPATLQLTLGNAAAFSAFLPGVTQSYTTTTTATVVSTAANATLTVADPSSQNTGHLVNGTYFLASPLEAGAAHAGDQVTVTAPVGSTAAPTTILTWDGPASETISLLFKQDIAATEGLRTGPYVKTLNFTLSTTEP
ncbi:MAG TPA: hypothetical protein VFZ00_08155 [Solirubrobacter sp.]|nr:hypothetical protein [Solirubrobacter sp.]